MSRDIWLTISEKKSNWINDNESDELDRVEFFNDDLGRIIDHIWRLKRLPNNICTVNDEKIFIEVMRRKYVYPDYMELVGEASPEDFKQSPFGNYLSTERKADLLLLGTFFWKGMYIAKVPHHLSHASKGWQVCTDTEFAPCEGLGLLWVQRGEWITTPHIFDDFTFMPFYKYDDEPLYHYLVQCEIELGYRKPLGKFQKLMHRDKNPYNCHPDNMFVAEKRGRKMYCVQCGNETTKSESKVIRDLGQKLRYCISCLNQ